jgi:hypothetical protein
MNQEQLARRSDLLQRKEEILSRHGSGFEREMEEIILELETLVREVDAAGGDPLERARNWRSLGEACGELAITKDPGPLEKALAAYRQAEALLSGIADRNEEMLVNYGIGRTLLDLSRCLNLPLAKEARRRYMLALGTARLAAPEFEDPIQEALMSLDRIVTLLEERNDLCRQIVWLKGSRKRAGAEEYDLDIQIPEDAALFRQLLDIHHRMSQLRGLQRAGV